MSSSRRSSRNTQNKKNSGQSQNGITTNTTISTSMSSATPVAPTDQQHLCPMETMNCDSCKRLTETLNKLIDKVTMLEKKIDEQNAKIAAQNLQITEKTVLAEAPVPNQTDRTQLEERLTAIEERIEERTNRQMRQTLVFRGIKEEVSEKTWSDTDSLLADTLGTALDIDATNMINRCHRTGNPDYYAGVGRARPIAAAMHSWKDCERIIEHFRKDGSNIFVDYKYGPRTTKRRNLALKLRQELKQKNELRQAYISYPAKLMGKRTGETRYSLIEDFSKHTV